MLEEVNQEENLIEDAVKVVREEYEKQMSEMKQKYEEEIAKIRKEEHEKTVQTIKAVMSGRTTEISENPAPEKELSFEEQLIRDTRKNLNL